MAGRWDVDLATPTAQAEFLLDFRESFPKGEFSAAFGANGANKVAWLAEQLRTAASAEPFVKAEIEDQLAVELEQWNFFWDIAEKLKPYFADKPHEPSSELNPICLCPTKAEKFCAAYIVLNDLASAVREKKIYAVDGCERGLLISRSP